MQTDNASLAHLLAQYVQHFAGTMNTHSATGGRESLRRINCELAAAPATRPIRPRPLTRPAHSATTTATMPPAFLRRRD